MQQATKLNEPIRQIFTERYTKGNEHSVLKIG